VLNRKHDKAWGWRSDAASVKRMPSRIDNRANGDGILRRGGVFATFVYLYAATAVRPGVAMASA
jgi:hypothetical protein